MNRVGITIMQGDYPAFDLILYGVTMQRICTVPGGGAIVERALKRRGLNPDDFWTTMFLAYEYPRKERFA